MSGQSRESISALIDGEASEIEVHRLLRELEDNGELRRSFLAYQQIRQAVRNPAGSHSQLSVDGHLSLFDSISDAVAEEESYELSTPVARRWLKPAGGLAVAASLVLAVGIAVTREDSPELPVAASETPVVTQQVSNTVEPQSELRELDEEKQRMLREYLNQHDRMARMKGNPQLVNYPGNQK